MRKPQQGAALIVALLIVTLAASTAAFAVWQQSLWVRQLENLTDRAKADQLAAGAMDLARNVLKDDKDKSVDSLGEPWAQAIVLPAEDATLSGQITDEQGKFNVNNLVTSNKINTSAVEGFARLLKSLKVDKELELATAVADWINPDSTALANTNLPYLALEPPYSAGGRPMIDIGELARVKGFTPDIVRTIAPFVAAIDTGTPTATSVNVNTASAEVLAAVIENLSVADAQTVLKKRATPFKSLAALAEALPPTAKCPDNACDVKSNYFMAIVRVKSGRIEAGYAALLARTTTGTAGSWPGIIWRKEAAD